jgi:hypothetical protein
MLTKLNWRPFSISFALFSFQGPGGRFRDRNCIISLCVGFCQRQFMGVALQYVLNPLLTTIALTWLFAPPP